MAKERQKKIRELIVSSLMLFLLGANVASAFWKLPKLEKAKRLLIKNPNSVEGKLLWWRGLLESGYWQEAKRQEKNLLKMWKALSKKEQERFGEILKIREENEPVLLEKRLKEIEKEIGRKENKALWVEKARMEMRLGRIARAKESLQKAREMDRVDETLEKIEREMQKA